MDLGITGKRALITGAGRGLGKAIAQSLAREGAKVAAVSRTAADIENLLHSIGGTKKGHFGAALDLAQPTAPGKLIHGLKKAKFGPVDIVVHNMGGTLNINDPFCSIEDWRRVWRFNLGAAIELNQHLIPPMRKQRWGRIVLISSISSMENQGPVPYCSVKAALTAYARSMGRVLAPDGVVMTALLPGAVMTEGGYWDDASKNRPDHVRKYLDERMAIRRLGRPEEISEIAAFLCSAHASFCIGSIVPVDGGQGRSFFGQ